MKIFVKIRKSLTRYSIRKKKTLRERNRKVHNFTSAKSIGIFFDINDTESFKAIRAFSKELKTKGISSEILGYVNSDEIPGELVLWEDCNVICTKDLDLIFRPKSPLSEKFILKEFDILFDLSLSDLITSYYIVSLSQAHFKVGKYTESENDLDLMININQNKSVKYLIEQINIYVEMLNKSE
ncbi:MAG: hypothetical protein K9H49_08770 [Bacteroidales bacterium]|nr:hypothetical protein [Bacteroidales bacterium]MCF8389522.1 hypothetical protein [Bacteroidales bacterium]